MNHYSEKVTLNLTPAHYAEVFENIAKQLNVFHSPAGILELAMSIVSHISSKAENQEAHEFFVDVEQALGRKKAYLERKAEAVAFMRDKNIISPGKMELTVTGEGGVWQLSELLVEFSNERPATKRL